MANVSSSRLEFLIYYNAPRKDGRRGAEARVQWSERKELINWRYLPETAHDPSERIVSLLSFFLAHLPSRPRATRTRQDSSTHRRLPTTLPSPSHVSIRILMRIDAHVSLP